MGAPVVSDRRRFDSAEIPVPCPTVLPGIAVEYLSPETSARHTDAVVVTRHRREVADHGDHVLVGVSFSQEAHDAFFRVVGIDPLETG
jgi:hypothetical protein